MNALLLVVSLISLSLAGYPVDFASQEDRVDGAGFWLEPGTYSSDVSSRTDLNSSYLEIQIAPEQLDVDCFYSVWFNDVKVAWGTFNSGTPSVIPIIGHNVFQVTGSGSDSVSVQTSNCYLGRFAVPYVMGDNGDALYLSDIHPTTVEKGFTNDNSYPAHTNYYPGREFGGAYADVESLHLSVNSASGLCKFNSQACEAQAVAQSYWSPSYYGQIPVQVTWSEASFYDATAEVVVENSAWYGVAFANYYTLCNTSTASGSCNLESEYSLNDDYMFSYNDYSGEVWMYYNTENYKKRDAEAYTPGNGGWGQVQQSNMNSTRSFYRTYWTFTPDNGGEIDTSVIIYYSPNQVVFPYVKVWSIGTADAMHVLADMRGAANGDCNLENGDAGLTYDATTNGVASYGLYTYAGFTYQQPVALPSTHATTGQTYGNDQAWLYCGQSPAGDKTSACATLQVNFNKQDLTGGTVLKSSAVVAPIALNDGGFINPVVYDLGIPYIYNPACLPTTSSGPTNAALNIALNQVSNFNFVVNGTTVGNTQQLFITRFDRLLIGGFGVQGYVLGPNAAPSLSLASEPDFSMTAAAYIQVNAFAPAMCDDTQCRTGYMCADKYNSPNCDCGLLYAGQNCTDLLQYCSGMDAHEYCLNGGACVESEARAIQMDGDGDSVVYGATSCDCTGTAGVDNTGDYRGFYCETPAPCDAEPCLNGGACTNGAGSDFTCDCSGTQSPNSTQPFTGTYCELSGTTTCDIGPCENGATCTPDDTAAGGYTCACVNGWTGNTCTIAPITACDANPDHCKPFGVCIPSANPDALVAFAQCVCLWGYSGETCTEQPKACSDNSVVCENDGHCIGFAASDATAYGCLCQDPWVGQRCQWNYTNPPNFS